MRLVLDGKSLLFGAFAGAAFVAGVGAVQKGEPQPGRYRIEAAGTNSSTTAYILDTATGQVWRENRDANFSGSKLGAAE